MRRVSIALLAVLVAALAAAGCGDSKSSKVPTKAEYKQEFNAINTDIKKVGEDISKAITGSTGKSNKVLEKTFGDLADRTKAIVKTVEDTTPPADAAIKKNHEAMLKGLKASADDLAKISKSAGKNDLKGAGEAAAKLTRDSPTVGIPRVALDKQLGIKP